VRPWTRHLDTGLANIERGATGDGRRADRLEWRQSAEKYVPIGRGGARVLDVIDQRCTNGSGQRVGRRIAGLALAYLDAIVAPIDIIEFERGDLASAQSIGREHPEHRKIPLAGGRTSINPGEHALHLIPADRSRNPGVSKMLGKLDQRAQVFGDYAFAV